MKTITALPDLTNAFHKMKVGIDLEIDLSLNARSCYSFGIVSAIQENRLNEALNELQRVGNEDRLFLQQVIGEKLTKQVMDINLKN
tara:strand:- start:563 stop:820 length:258 start_codon:yes stop_codon:yes gene_type:complete